MTMLLAVLEQVLRWTIAAVFLSALAGKLLAAGAWIELADSLAALPVLRSVRKPARSVMTRGLAIWLGTAEAAIAVLLVVPAAQRWGFAAATAVALVLTIGVALLLNGRAALHCRCFGPSSLLTRRTVWRNATLTAGALLGVVLASVVGGEPRAAAVVAGVCVSVAILAGLRHWRDVIALIWLSRNPVTDTDGVARAGR